MAFLMSDIHRHFSNEHLDHCAFYFNYRAVRLNEAWAKYKLDVYARKKYRYKSLGTLTGCMLSREINYDCVICSMLTMCSILVAFGYI